MTLFRSEADQERLVIFCPMELNVAAAEDFKSACKSWMMNPVPVFVLDCQGVTKVSRDFYQALIHFKSALKHDDKKIFTLHLREQLQRQLRSDGVEPVFNPVTTLPERKVVKAKPVLNVEFINPFLAATLKTLEVQCSTPVKVGKPYLGEAPTGIAIASVLSLASNGFNGSIVLCFPEVVFLKIYENMFDEKATAITGEIQDAASELLNIIYGLAKVDLNQKGHTFQKALPTVLIGDNIKVRHNGRAPSVQIPFEIAAGTFYVTIEFNSP